MSEHRELGAARRPRPFLARALAALCGGVFYWMPVWIPLGLLAQVALLGMKPALAESRRLAVHERVLTGRLEERVSRRDELRALFDALADPVYRERLRLERGAR